MRAKFFTRPGKARTSQDKRHTHKHTYVYLLQNWNKLQQRIRWPAICVQQSLLRPTTWTDYWIPSLWKLCYTYLCPLCPFFLSHTFTLLSVFATLYLLSPGNSYPFPSFFISSTEVNVTQTNICPQHHMLNSLNNGQSQYNYGVRIPYVKLQGCRILKLLQMYTWDVREIALAA